MDPYSAIPRFLRRDQKFCSITRDYSSRSSHWKLVAAILALCLLGTIINLLLPNSYSIPRAHAADNMPPPEKNVPHYYKASNGKHYPLTDTGMCQLVKDTSMEVRGASSGEIQKHCKQYGISL